MQVKCKNKTYRYVIRCKYQKVFLSNKVKRRTFLSDKTCQLFPFLNLLSWPSSYKLFYHFRNILFLCKSCTENCAHMNKCNTSTCSCVHGWLPLQHLTVQVALGADLHLSWSSHKKDRHLHQTGGDVLPQRLLI